jgi:hypothetical protein
LVGGQPDPNDPNEPEWAPQDRVHRVEYTYFADGKLETVTARSGLDPNAPIVTQNQYDYDDARNLAAEWQQHGAANSGSTIKMVHSYARSEQKYPSRICQGCDRAWVGQ